MRYYGTALGTAANEKNAYNLQAKQKKFYMGDQE